MKYSQFSSLFQEDSPSILRWRGIMRQRWCPWLVSHIRALAYEGLRPHTNTSILCQRIGLLGVGRAAKNSGRLLPRKFLLARVRVSQPNAESDPVNMIRTDIGAFRRKRTDVNPASRILFDVQFHTSYDWRQGELSEHSSGWWMPLTHVQAVGDTDDKPYFVRFSNTNECWGLQHSTRLSSMPIITYRYGVAHRGEQVAVLF